MRHWNSWPREGWFPWKPSRSAWKVLWAPSDLVEDLGHCRGVGLDDLWRSFQPKYYMILNWKPQMSGQREAQFWTSVLTHQLSNSAGSSFKICFSFLSETFSKGKKKTLTNNLSLSLDTFQGEISKHFFSDKKFLWNSTFQAALVWSIFYLLFYLPLQLLHLA